MSFHPPVARALVRMEGVRKHYGSVAALDGARLELAGGEVHGVLGENGAGKTTLLEILGGLVHPDEGTIEVDGRPVRIRTPREAWRSGIGMVHQHFTLVPRLTVLENLALGRRSRARGLALPLADLRVRASGLMDRTGLDVELDAPVESLGVGRQQRVEILKVLLRDPRVLVLDEPTAVLSPAEVDGLLSLLGRLARREDPARSLDDAPHRRAVVMVAHKLDEVLAVADRVTVLRAGRTVLEAGRDEVDASVLARAMVGRDVDAPARQPGSGHGDEVVARLDGVEVHTERRSGLRGVHLWVSRGEIVGVAGVEGNGQRALALVLAGRRAPDAGTVSIPRDPGFIPQDRRREGLIPGFDLAENVALARHLYPAFRRGPFLRWGALRRTTREAMERFGIRAPGPSTPAAALSGGNQQRVVVARELGRHPDLLVAENPTRGLDVAGEAFVHRELLALRERPAPPGIVLISTDLDEVFRLADRIFVMVRGELQAVPPGRWSREGVGALMLSGARNRAL